MAPVAMAPRRLSHRTCPLCEAMCGLTLELERDRVATVRGDGEDPFSRGHICPKGPALKAIHEDPDRLRRPLRRRGRGPAATYEEVSWEEALEATAAGLLAVQRAHGADSVATYLGNPTVHNLGAMLFASEVVRALRSRSRFSATSVDQLPHQLVAFLLYGHQLLVPVPDLDRTDHVLMLGANPVASNGSLMTAPDVKARFTALRRRGGTLVVVDPRRTETAELADQHVFLRPGTDALLLAALVNVAFQGGRGPGHLAAAVDGLDILREALAPFTPERAEGPTGIAAATIRGLGRAFCAAPRAVCYGRFGTSTQRFGAVSTFLIQILNLLTGNLDRPGGALVTHPAIDLVAGPPVFRVHAGSFGRWRSRVSGRPEFAGELPVAVLAEEMETRGAGQVRALLTHAGNPVLSTPDGRRLDRALEGLDFMVSVDPYLNETTRHADVILPPPSPLERPHYDLVFHVLAIRNTARYAPPVFAPAEGAWTDAEILGRLALRLLRDDGSKARRGRLQLRAMLALGAERIVDLALRAGPYGPRLWPPREGLSVARLRRARHGVDLGPLRPGLLARMAPHRARIDAAPRVLVEDLRRLADGVPTAPEALLCIGRRHLRSNNSWMHNVPKLQGARPLCTLLMHPADAARRGLETGARVRVRSPVGEIEVPLEVSESVMEGVVSLPHGFGHDRPGVRLRIAQGRPGASLNDLTDAAFVDELSGNAALSGFEVTVSARAPEASSSSSG